jgi:HPt (histidine-containing phosphotransfer) domain-containing protein
MEQVSDLTFLKTFTSNDSAKITKYVNMFLNAAGPSLAQMKEQVAGSDWKSLKTSAHSLKSQLKYMGVATGVELAYAIESSAGEGQNLDQIPGMLEKLEGVVNTASNELKAAIGSL